jgi:hypothetical protein
MNTVNGVVDLVAYAGVVVAGGDVRADTAGVAETVHANVVAVVNTGLKNKNQFQMF